MKPDPGDSDKVQPSFNMRDAYMLEYLDVQDKYKKVHHNLTRNWNTNNIKTSVAYSNWLVVLLSLSMKLVPKIQKDQNYINEYTVILETIQESRTNPLISLTLALECMDAVSAFLEDVGFTNLGFKPSRPGGAVKEW